jgi:serine protease Do
MKELENNEKLNTMKKMIKKGASISLCAVLTGGLAAGAFQGVNTITGWNTQSVSAASNSKAELTTTKDESDSSTKGSLDVSDIVAEAMPSVVSITTKSIQEVQSYYGMFGYGGYAPQEQEVEGSGSGIIIGKNDTELLVATNYHVVEDADTLSVCFVDNEAYEGSVKGYDENKDLAVVSVLLDDISDDTMDQISIATIGSSDDLVVGEQVVAIGNALGYGQSVTTGIVSAKNRRLDSTTSSVESGDVDSTDGVNLIQTDAAINPGNSGGALLNMNGEVVGINSAKLASTEVEGMGYAIAISDVSDILENLMNEVKRDRLEDDEHGILGITGSTVSTEGIQIYGIPQGVYVSDVTEGGAADEAGIKKNYVITAFDGKSITSIDQLVERLYYYAPGEEVDVTVQVLGSDGYEEKTVTVTLGENTNASSDDDEDEDDAEEEESRKGDSRKGDSRRSDSQDEDDETESEDGGDDIFEDWENGTFSNSSARSYGFR